MEWILFQAMANELKHTKALNSDCLSSNEMEVVCLRRIGWRYIKFQMLP